MQRWQKSYMRKLKSIIERILEMMAMLFAIRVVEERTTFERVPNKLKAQVAEIIVHDFGLPELVSEEYRDI